MGHNLNYNRARKTYSFVSHAEKAWHGLGTIVDNAMTAEEAIRLANLDHEVYKTTIHPMIDGDYGVKIPERFATVRRDTGDFLGIVSNRYEIVQNKDAFVFFDSIIDSGEAIFETAGALGNGERIFVTAKLPDDILVKGEPCNKYIVLTNSHDGSSSIIAGFTNIRVVCSNTLQASLRSLTNKVSIRHNLGAKDRLAEASKVMGLCSIYNQQVEEIFNEMAKKEVSEKEMKDFFTNVFRAENYNSENADVTEDEKEESSTRFNNQIEDVMQFAYTHSTQQGVATKDTLWGAYNAVSGYYNYVKSYKKNEDKMKSQLFGLGSRRVNKAFKLANDLITI